MNKPSNIHKSLLILIIVSTAIRALIAGFIELGNDEVYYWTYALYPDLSHFDHPPMVGYVIQMFTLNLNLSGEFFIRLGAVVFGAINTWIIFLIGTKIKDQLTGLYAAFLYTASIYCFIIAGIFILPDTPQLFFWLISIYVLIQSLPDKSISVLSKKYLLLAGIFIGFAMLSKYTSLFLWLGTIIYILFFNRKWLLTKELYLAAFITLIIFIPVIKWNMDNDFISFGYHSGRVGFFGSGFRPDFIGTELVGQFFYNNPATVILIIISLIALYKKKRFIDNQYKRLLLLLSLPFIFTFLFIALFRRTLPHWTGPGYLSLILIASAYLSGLVREKSLKMLIPGWIKAGMSILILVIILGLGQLQFGMFNISRFVTDITAEMYGWDKLRDKMAIVFENDSIEQKMSPDAYIVSRKWFPAAHLDYYVASHLEKKFLAYNILDDIHKYAWINKERGGAAVGSDAYYITTSLNFKDPLELYHQNWETIDPPDTIGIYRNKKIAKEVYIYRMHNLIKVPTFDLPEKLR